MGYVTAMFTVGSGFMSEAIGDEQCVCVVMMVDILPCVYFTGNLVSYSSYYGWKCIGALYFTTAVSSYEAFVMTLCDDMHIMCYEMTSCINFNRHHNAY